MLINNLKEVQTNGRTHIFAERGIEPFDLPFSFSFLQRGRTVIRSGCRTNRSVVKLGFVITILEGCFICICH